jgi:biopolymer transport protein ExbD
MVDVIFMLTIFFMLVIRFTEAELIPMNLPDPAQSKALPESVPERVIINCRPANPNDPMQGEVHYSVGPNLPESLDVISNRLVLFKRDNPNVKVVIRADRRLPYEQVNRVMRIVAHAGIDMLNVAAHINDGG